MEKVAGKLTDGWVWENDHHIGVGRKHVNVGSKAGVDNFHALKLSRKFAANVDVKFFFRQGYFSLLPARELELFDDVADFFKSVNVFVAATLRMWNDQESCPLEQKNFVSINDGGKLLQTLLQLLHIWYEHVDDAWPSLYVTRHYLCQQIF